MFRHSLMTLAVTAGLLAAAGPASAATAGPPHPEADGYFTLSLDGMDCGVVSRATEELSGNYNFLLEAAGRAR
jgi:hypothetical protein